LIPLVAISLSAHPLDLSSSSIRGQRQLVSRFFLTIAADIPGEQMVARHKISGAGVMKGFDFAKSGRWVFAVRTRVL
jgi:hypothetical protein